MKKSKLIRKQCSQCGELAITYCNHCDRELCSDHNFNKLRSGLGVCKPCMKTNGKSIIRKSFNFEKMNAMAYAPNPPLIGNEIKINFDEVIDSTIIHERGVKDE